jgi:aspartyl protease family protein
MNHALGEEPCDRRRALELSRELLSQGKDRAVAKHSAAFIGRCGEFPDLRRAALSAHMTLSDWDLAAEQATKLIEADPFSAEYRALRGLAFEQKRDWERAADDFRQALALRPRLADIPLNLSIAYERLGRYCDAAFPLEQLTYYYPGPASDTARARASELNSKGGCAAVPGTAAKVRFNPHAGIIMAKVRVNGAAPTSFVVDTGASYVTLTRRLAHDVGLDVARASQLLVQTANGRRTASVVSLDSVAIGGLTALRVPAVVVDDLGPNIDGLLGLSFLARFDIHHSAGSIEITPRRTASALVGKR